MDCKKDNNTVDSLYIKMDHIHNSLESIINKNTDLLNTLTNKLLRLEGSFDDDLIVAEPTIAQRNRDESLGKVVSISQTLNGFILQLDRLVDCNTTLSGAIDQLSYIQTLIK